MDRAKFFASLRARGSGVFGTSLSQGQVDNLNVILDEIEAASLPLAHAAYDLAIAYHEVGSALVPKSENLNYRAERIRQVWPSRFPSVAAAQPYAGNPQKLANKVYGGKLGNTEPGDGWKYRGRGYPQTTGRENYTKASKVVGVDLVNDPDRAMEPRIAARILIEGSERGMFTGKKLSDFLLRAVPDYYNARSVINADVKANGAKIAGYARSFEAALKAAGYTRQKTVPLASPKPVEAPKPTLQPVNPTPQVPAPKKGLGALLAALLSRMLGRK